jgi:hypothetical protein
MTNIALSISSTTRRISLAVVLGLLAAAVVASGADAATQVTTWGAPGAVYESANPVICTQQVVAYNFGMSYKGVKVFFPTVYARTLSNNSRSQYIMEQVHVYDATTGTWDQNNYTSWGLASTTQGVTFNPLLKTVGLNDQALVEISIWWWDPVSASYTGYMDYLVDTYYRSNYGIPGSQYTFC